MATRLFPWLYMPWLGINNEYPGAKVILDPLNFLISTGCLIGYIWSSFMKMGIYSDPNWRTLYCPTRWNTKAKRKGGRHFFVKGVNDGEGGALAFPPGKTIHIQQDKSTKPWYVRIPYSTYYKPMGDLPYISSEQGCRVYNTYWAYIRISLCKFELKRWVGL